MTLIVGVVSPKYVALVSDRRVTWTQGTVITRQEDSDTKTFNFGGQALVGFTGVARLEGLRMESWLSEALADERAVDYPKAVQSRMTAAFRRDHLTNQPHAFLGVGYINSRDVLTPWSYLISNALNSAGEFDALSPTDQFRMAGRLLRPGESVLRTVGYPVPKALHEQAQKDIWECLRQDDANPSSVVAIMTELVHQVALTSNGYVGSSVLITTLPKTSFGASGVVLPFGGVIDDETWRTVPLGFSTSRDFLGRGSNVGYSPASFDEHMMIVEAQFVTGSDPELLPPEGTFR